MLLAVHTLDDHRIPLLHLGNDGFSGLARIVHALLINGAEARKTLMLAIEAQTHAIAVDIHAQGIVNRRVHLAGYKTGIDQPVQLELFLGQGLLDRIRRTVHIRGADGLVSVLRVAASLIDDGLGRQIFLAILGGDVTAHGGQRLLADGNGVGTDIGDKTLHALFFQLDALVELLHHLHGFLGSKVQLAARLLLQTGGGKGRGSLLALFAVFHAIYSKMRLLHAFACGSHFGLVG